MRASRWVLIAEGGHGFSRGAIAAVRALAAAGYYPAVTVSKGGSLAAASRHCARRVMVPPTTTDPSGFAARVQEELVLHPYLTVLPANDDALIALDWPVRHLIDKVTCAERAVAVGFPVPPSRVFESAAAAIAAAAEFDYPVVVKPDTKRYLASRVDSAAGLASAIREDGRLIVQPFLRTNLRGLLGLVWQGELVGAAHLRYLRIWPQPCGTAAAAVTVRPDPILEERALRLLGDYEGLFHMDLSGDNLLDLNPRIHATTAAAVAGGVNLPALYCDLIAGRTVTKARARSGVFYRWIEGDVRGVMQGLRERTLTLGEAASALRPRLHAVHGFEALDDPGPVLARVHLAARQVLRRVTP